MSARRAYNPAGRTEIARLKRVLDALFVRVESFDPGDEIIGDLNRYLCVRVCGYLEQSIVSLSRAACERTSGSLGQAFALSWLERAPNPSRGEVIRIVQRFSPDWAQELQEMLKVDNKGDRLNALVGIRNDVAHGKNQGVSAKQARDYYELATEVIGWLADRLDPRVGSVTS